MTRNMGRTDRILRIAAAVLLAIVVFGTDLVAGGVLRWLAIAVAAIFAVTALAGMCPLYRLFGIRTCPSR